MNTVLMIITIMIDTQANITIHEVTLDTCLKIQSFYHAELVGVLVQCWKI